MGIRTTPLGATEIFCDGCGEVCMVAGSILVGMNISDERTWQQPVEWEPSAAQRKAGVRFCVRLRHGGADRRWSKGVAVDLPGARSTVFREWAWLCDADCGAKLAAPWERVDLPDWGMTGPGEPVNDPGSVGTDATWAAACARRVELRREPLR